MDVKIDFEMNWLCNEYNRSGFNTEINHEKQEVIICKKVLSFEDAAKKIKKDLDLYEHVRR